jgi:hypothetical protein
MRKLTPPRFLPVLALLLALAGSAAAQTNVDARSALATFPDSQAVLYINAHRIMNEALPRIMPPVEYQKLLAQAQKVGFDARGLEYAAVGVRFVEPAPASGMPEFVVVVRGNFNADSLLALARVSFEADKVARRQETYGSKTIEIIDMTSAGKSSEDKDVNTPEEKPKPSSYPELAVTVFDTNTLIVGVPAYVKSAIDAAGGQGQLKSSTLELATQDPQALWSLTAEIPASLAETFHKFGVKPNEEFDEMLGWMKQINLSQGMNALDFTINAALLTDQPEHASAFNGFVRMGILALQAELSEEAAKKRGKDAAQARQGLAVLKTVVNRADGNTLIISGSIPQKSVADFVHNEMSKKPAAKKSSPKRRTTRRRTTRRG